MTYHTRKKRPQLWIAVTLLIGFLLVAMLYACIQHRTIPIVSDVGFSFFDHTSNTDWNLVLVNADHALPKGETPELTTLSNGKQVDSRIYPALQEMFDAMRAEGIEPVVGEGYRTEQQQRDMMRDQIDAYLAEGYSQSEAESLAADLVAQPGYSEHQLGLAVDINADKSISTNEEVYAWLAEHAWEYGFILRYPADKTEITGISYEPWHYRYVGPDEAKEIYDKQICLEEYLGET